MYFVIVSDAALDMNVLREHPFGSVKQLELVIRKHLYELVKRRVESFLSSNRVPSHFFDLVLAFEDALMIACRCKAKYAEKSQVRTAAHHNPSSDFSHDHNYAQLMMMVACKTQLCFHISRTTKRTNILSEVHHRECSGGQVDAMSFVSRQGKITCFSQQSGR
jgi:hypothetical protein